MFTGLVETVGTVTRVQNQGLGKRFQIRAPEISGNLTLGESVAVSGVCLTVVSFNSEFLEVEVVQETLSRSTLNIVQSGAEVNLERSLRPTDRLGGHFVQGHVDGIGTIESFQREETGNFRLGIALPENLRLYAIEKGSIALDGVSLTIATLRDNGVEVALIPFTLEHTTFRTRQVGDRVNVEMDILAKYVFQFLKNQQISNQPTITESWLKKAGF